MRLRWRGKHRQINMLSLSLGAAIASVNGRIEGRSVDTIYLGRLDQIVSKEVLQPLVCIHCYTANAWWLYCECGIKHGVDGYMIDWSGYRLGDHIPALNGG